jgi:hypothetical protein
MTKKKQFNLRLSPDLVEMMNQYIKDNHREDNISLLIRESILEKVDPLIRSKMIKAEVAALRAENDPDICALFPLDPRR